MVSAVQGSNSSVAYLKSASLAPSNQQDNFRSKVETTTEDSQGGAVEMLKKAAKAGTDDNSGTSSKPQDTELSSRNDDRTLQAEQTRGSLLDMAV